MATTQFAKKIGPCGGCGGSLWEMTEESKRLESITVHVTPNTVVEKIEFNYRNFAGQKRHASPSDGPKGQPHTIDLDESEYVTEVSGTVGNHEDYTVITSIKFVTNLNKPNTGPWGDVDKGIPFTLPAPQGSAIVGFFAQVGGHLDAIGIYVRPL